MTPIYLDHCSTTPAHPEVVAAMQRVLAEEVGNPAAVQHVIGQKAKKILEQARGKIAQNLGVSANQVVFTGSATEANNMMIQGFALRHFQRPHRIITTAIEHKSVLEPCQHVAKFYGTKLEKLGVDRLGHIDLNELEKLLAASSTPTLVVAMHMNNEIPVRNPIEDIAKLVAKYEAFFHTDAVQGYVRDKVNWGAIGVSSAVLSPHKFYGPKGVGILVLGTELRATPFLPPYVGGEQETGFRPGTVNLAAVIGTAKAVEIHEQRRPELIKHMLACQSGFVQALEATTAPWHWTVPPTSTCPGILNLWFDRVNAQSLIESLPHICISRGATCSTAGEKHSHIPQTLGLSVEISANVLRISFGSAASPEEAADGGRQLVQTVLTKTT